MPLWWNGRHANLKNWSSLRAVKVRVLLGVPFILACAGYSPALKTGEPVHKTLEDISGCKEIDVTPNNDEEWGAFCYCKPTEAEFSQCIDDWYKWHWSINE